MMVKFNSWENTHEQMCYRELCLAFSEVTDFVAPTDHHFEEVKKWICHMLKKLQLNESSEKTKEIPKEHEFVEEENVTDKEERWDNILDQISKTRKGRSRKNRLKPTKRRSKKKHEAIKVDQGIDPMHSQVDLGSSTQGSMISNPFVLQPNMLQPWGMYRPPQQLTHEHSLMPHFHMSGQLPEIGAYTPWPHQQVWVPSNMTSPHPGP